MTRHLIRRQLWLALPVFFALMTYGCVTHPYEGNYNFSSVQGTDFSAFRTFDWLEEDSSFTRTAVVPEDRGQTNELLLRQTIEKALQEKGFSKVKSGKPDFYYAYRAAVFRELNQEIVEEDEKRQREEQIRESNESAASRNDFEFSRATLYQGTLKLLVLDGTTGKPVWSGTDSAFVETFRGSHAGGRLSVRGLLAQFPPQSVR